MRTALKWISILLAGLVGVLLIAYLVIYFMSEARLKRVYQIEVAPIPIPESVGSVEEVGFPLVAVSACGSCHGEDLGGQIMQDDPLSARFVAPNLTSGAGGLTADFTDKDWVRAVRYGVDPDGEPLLIIPSIEFGHFSDRDLGVLIAYLKNLPPVDNELPESEFGPLGRVMLVAGMLPPETIPAEVIDPGISFVAESPPEGTVEYGAYLGNFCTVCHGPDLAGSPNPVGDFTLSPMNLTPGGILATWSEEDFFNTLRTGVAPDDYELDPNEMPWETIGKTTDTQLRSVWLYLQTVPAVETEHR